MYSDVYNSSLELSSQGDISMLKSSNSQKLILSSSGASGYLTVDTNDSERIRVTSAGNVGIGTTSPNHKLDVDGDIGLNQYLYKNGDNNHHIRYIGATTQLQSPSKIDFRLGTNSAPQGGDFQFASGSGNDFTISYTRTGNAVFRQTFSGQAMHWQNNALNSVYYASPNGDVGIGTTSPAQKLTIGGIGTNNTDGLKIEDPSNTAYGAHYSYNDASSTVEIGGVTNNVLNDCISIARDATRTITINTSENVGIGTASPNAKLQVAGGVQMADDTDTASAAKAGTLRYRTSGNNSYVDMCMQTGASTYAWVNIVTNNW